MQFGILALAQIAAKQIPAQHCPAANYSHRKQVQRYLNCTIQQRNLLSPMTNSNPSRQPDSQHPTALSTQRHCRYSGPACSTLESAHVRYSKSDIPETQKPATQQLEVSSKPDSTNYPTCTLTPVVSCLRFEIVNPPPYSSKRCHNYLVRAAEKLYKVQVHNHDDVTCYPRTVVVLKMKLLLNNC